MSITISVGQVLVMVVLMGLGWLSVKTRLVTLDSAKSVTNIVLYFVTPAVIIQAFQRPYDGGQLRTIGILLVVDLAIFSVAIGLARLIFRRIRDAERRAVLQFGTVYQNAGFMGIPLAQALFGADGVVYATVFVTAYNLTVWTHGDMLLAGPKRPSWGRGIAIAARTPALIATVVAIALFALSWHIPSPVSDVVGYLGGMNAPLSMFVVGTTLAQISLKTFARDRYSWLGTAVRNLVMPAIVLVALTFVPLDPTARLGTFVAAACPVAAFVVIFSVRHERDTDFPTRLLCTSTLASIVTVPAWLAVASLWWGS